MNMKSKRLKITLKRIFGLYIRTRDFDYSIGYGKCITCGRMIEWGSNWQAGHFIPSTYLAVCFDEDNVHGQCKSCNYFKSGDLISYRKNLVAKIGEDRVCCLELKKGNKTKIYDFMYRHLINEYKHRTIKLREVLWKL